MAILWCEAEYYSHPWQSRPLPHGFVIVP